MALDDLATLNIFWSTTGPVPAIAGGPAGNIHPLGSSLSYSFFTEGMCRYVPRG
jgi:hypothetical protein